MADLAADLCGCEDFRVILNYVDSPNLGFIDMGSDLRAVGVRPRRQRGDQPDGRNPVKGVGGICGVLICRRQESPHTGSVQPNPCRMCPVGKTEAICSAEAAVEVVAAPLLQPDQLAEQLVVLGGLFQRVDPL